MIDFSDIKIYTKDGKEYTYQDLLAELHSNSIETNEAIQALATKLVEMIDSPAAAVSVMEHLNKLFTSKVKNDELLLKMASVLSRLIKNEQPGADDDGYMLTDDEKRKLLNEAKAEFDKLKQ